MLTFWFLMGLVGSIFTYIAASAIEEEFRCPSVGYLLLLLILACLGPLGLTIGCMFMAMWLGVVVVEERCWDWLYRPVCNLWRK